MLSEVVLAPGSSLGQWQLASSLQREKMLYAYQATGSDEVSVEEGDEVMILEPDGTSSYPCMLSEVVLAPGSSLGQWQLASSLQRELGAPLLGFGWCHACCGYRHTYGFHCRPVPDAAKHNELS
jgi:hypothetical protein